MKPLLSEDEIQASVAQLARRLASEYRGRPLTVLGVLTGSLMFLSDLVRRFDFPLRVGLIQASSYRGRTTVPGELVIATEALPDVAGRDVLLLDDIFDTGRTIASLSQAIAARGPQSVSSAVLLWKEGRQRVDINPDYFCFRIPDVFVVGYGLDYNDDYRHLPYVAALEASDLAGEPASA
ncbi:MAG: hypoxanthine phosphoribosyltransferase [Planctomycetaceae bacterium]